MKTESKIDVSGLPREGDHYVIRRVAKTKDYWNSVNGKYIWSIGRRKRDGKILASHTPEFYQNPAFECLWLR